MGRTAESAALALSHSGALAGNHAAYQALFDRYGVIEVDDLDGLANCLLLFGQPRRVGQGGLATMHDSGGLRELAIDLATAHGVPYARIADATRQKLAARLEYGLEPTNPLDAWGTGHDYESIFTDCLQALADDPDTAIAHPLRGDAQRLLPARELRPHRAGRRRAHRQARADVEQPRHRRQRRSGRALHAHGHAGAGGHWRR